VLFNNSETRKATDVFKKAEAIYTTLEEEDIEPEMVSQRSALAKALGVPVKE
jgi:hypothetical protein